jgi:hypothetical protein
MGFGNLFKKKSKSKGNDASSLDADRRTAAAERTDREAAEQAAIQDALAHAIPTGVDIQTKLQTSEGKLYHLIKVKNETSDIMGDVKVAIAPEDEHLVSCATATKSAKFIDPGSSEVFKFTLIPKMKCGSTNIQGLIRYFDFADKMQQEFILPEHRLNITYPEITSMDVDEDVWRVNMGRMKAFEVETEELTFEPSKLFTHFTKIIEKMGFFPLKPNIVPSLYRGQGKFFGLDPLKEPHCVEVQVIGRGGTSRLLLRVWTPSVTRSMGITFRFLGRVDKKIDIKNKIKFSK